MVIQLCCGVLELISFFWSLYLRRGIKGRQRREIFHVLIHFQNGCHNQGWAWLKSGASNSMQVSHISGRSPNTQAFAALIERWIGKGAVKILVLILDAGLVGSYVLCCTMAPHPRFYFLISWVWNPSCYILLLFCFLAFIAYSHHYLKFRPTFHLSCAKMIEYRIFVFCVWLISLDIMDYSFIHCIVNARFIVPWFDWVMLDIYPIFAFAMHSYIHILSSSIHPLMSIVAVTMGMQHFCDVLVSFPWNVSPEAG